MLEILLSILLTFAAGGDPCLMGDPLDWEDWARELGDRAALSVTYHSDGLDFWLYQGDGETVLFVFGPYTGGGDWHGRCARRMAG